MLLCNPVQIKKKGPMCILAAFLQVPCVWASDVAQLGDMTRMASSPAAEVQANKYRLLFLFFLKCHALADWGLFQLAGWLAGY